VLRRYRWTRTNTAKHTHQQLLVQIHGTIARMRARVSGNRRVCAAATGINSMIIIITHAPYIHVLVEQTCRPIGVCCRADRPTICSRVVTPLRLFASAAAAGDASHVTAISTRFTPHACEHDNRCRPSCLADCYYYYWIHVGDYCYCVMNTSKPRITPVPIAVPRLCIARARRPRRQINARPRRRVYCCRESEFVCECVCGDDNLETRERKLFIVTVIFDCTACTINITRLPE